MIKVHSAYFKSIVKNLLPLFPFYASLCFQLRKLKRNQRFLSWIERLPIPNRYIVHFYINNNDILLANADRCSIAKKLFWDHGIRQPTEDNISISLFYYLSQTSDVVLDIGTNSGLFALVAAKANSSAKIIAFDILPEALHIFYDNIMINNLAGKILFRLCGVGSNGQVFSAPLYEISSEMPSSLSLDNIIETSCNVQVPVSSLDEILDPFADNSRAVLIKIDTEGTEVDIFINGLKSLELFRPDIICEILSFSNYSKIDSILSLFNYSRYLITDRGLLLCDVLKPSAKFKDWYFTTKYLNKSFFGFDVITC